MRKRLDILMSNEEIFTATSDTPRHRAKTNNEKNQRIKSSRRRKKQTKYKYYRHRPSTCLYLSLISFVFGIFIAFVSAIFFLSSSRNRIPYNILLCCPCAIVTFLLFGCVSFAVFSSLRLFPKRIMLLQQQPARTPIIYSEDREQNDKTYTEFRRMVWWPIYESRSARSFTMTTYARWFLLNVQYLVLPIRLDGSFAVFSVVGVNVGSGIPPILHFFRLLVSAFNF